ncbi:hypothetical protein F8O06_05125 [Pseudoclavibacter sp. CFCC 14310]|uniref:hypothetical protein n=1 Tax=Pseudoclavibacter sp. CFCC 14310 TaxID=2615180 RepID=UPI001301425E|nr:hypothetical protein [Pseudoclavibacter sp. CFCC 14310]KAB1646147.1 hypothetical protein F8O06_05125 [Pseudoclavibacter sp. CFCC 14310]
MEQPTAIEIIEHDGRIYLSVLTSEGTAAVEAVPSLVDWVFEPVTEADAKLLENQSIDWAAQTARLRRREAAKTHAIRSHHPTSTRWR